ncbi:hypothetical protein [Segetibacter aerophilus]|uniref:Uncharacterized protein n=1 Tax=Segetibacter aerophilus TaxID=670293 RepID=A0A512B731_9BACT|nr:hypothetical protein [Segetibacter aerophilus]GEO07783.1 hypothetical protein SAE01_02790 [Segetibacter aerophilus]
MENINQETDITLEHSTPVELAIQDQLNEYYHDQEKIDARLLELDAEMDLESYMQTEGTALTIAGVILALTVNKKWLALPLATSLLSLANIVRGRNRPLTVFRKLGFRTRAEIEKERYALKAIRGDFKYLLDVPNAVWNAVNK